MAFFDELGKKAKAAAAVASEKAQNAAELAKINIAIASEQRELDKTYKTIGEWFVTEFEGEIPEAVQGMVEAVAASKAKIAELEDSKRKEEAPEETPEETPEVPAKACPVCGAAGDSKFCPQCGAPMGE